MNLFRPDYLTYHNYTTSNFLVPNPARVNSPEKALWFASHIDPCKLPRITEKQLVRIVGYLAKTDFQPNTHFDYLGFLEKGFRTSGKFTLEKTTKIFQEYIEGLQKELAFDVNKQFKLDKQTWITPLGFGALVKAPSLMNALIKSGAEVNCAQRTYEISSPYHLVCVNYYGRRDYDNAINVDKRWLHNYDFSHLKADCINILISHQGDPNSICKTKLVRHVSCYRFDKLTKNTTALWIHLIDIMGSISTNKTLRTLIKANADINSRNNGETPLSFLAKQMNDDKSWKFVIMKDLVESGADPLISNDGRWLHEITKDCPKASEYLQAKITEKLFS